MRNKPFAVNPAKNTLYSQVQRRKRTRQLWPLAVFDRLQLIPPFVEQAPVNAKLLGECDDIIATLQPLHSHLPKCVRILANCSLICHLQSLSLHSVPIASVSIEGAVHTCRLPVRNRLRITSRYLTSAIGLVKLARRGALLLAPLRRERLF